MVAVLRQAFASILQSFRSPMANGAGACHGSSGGLEVGRNLAVQEHRPGGHKRLLLCGTTGNRIDFGSAEPETDQAEDGLDDDDGRRDGGTGRGLFRPLSQWAIRGPSSQNGTHQMRTSATATRSRAGRPDSPLGPWVCGCLMVDSAHPGRARPSCPYHGSGSRQNRTLPPWAAVPAVGAAPADDERTRRSGFSCATPSPTTSRRTRTP
jgi:hypothetical protein